MKFKSMSGPFCCATRFVARRRFQRGVTSIEYALIGSLIAVAIVGTVMTLGLTVEDFFSLLSVEVSKAAAAGG